MIKMDFWISKMFHLSVFLPLSPNYPFANKMLNSSMCCIHKSNVIILVKHMHLSLLPTHLQTLYMCNFHPCWSFI